MPFALTIEHGPHRGVPRGEVARRIRAMIKLLQLEESEISFLLTNDDRVHQLNKIYRKKDRPTDVLAFSMREGRFGALAGSVLGDVIVSVPTARKQAEERRVDVLEEVTMLLAHGLLHLLGYDHDTPSRDRRMRAETGRLCRAARRRGTSVRGSSPEPPLKAGSRPRSFVESSTPSGRLARRPGRRATQKPRS